MTDKGRRKKKRDEWSWVKEKKKRLGKKKPRKLSETENVVCKIFSKVSCFEISQNRNYVFMRGAVVSLRWDGGFRRKEEGGE